MRNVLKIVLFYSCLSFGCSTENSKDFQKDPVYLDFISHFDGTQIIEINGDSLGENKIEREYQWYNIIDHLQSNNENKVRIHYHGLSYEFEIDLKDSARYYNIYYHSRIRNGIISVKKTKEYLPRF